MYGVAGCARDVATVPRWVTRPFLEHDHVGGERGDILPGVGDDDRGAVELREVAGEFVAHLVAHSTSSAASGSSSSSTQDP